MPKSLKFQSIIKAKENGIEYQVLSDDFEVTLQEDCVIFDKPTIKHYPLRNQITKMCYPPEIVTKHTTICTPTQKSSARPCCRLFGRYN